MHLVHHVKGSVGQHICTVAAIDATHIGVAIRNPKERSSRKVAAEVAIGRALCGTSIDKIPSRFERVRYRDIGGRYHYDTLPLSEIVADAVVRMKIRAKRYFKES